MNPLRSVLRIIVWLTRFAGESLAVGGLGLFVLAWTERSITLIAMGLITIAAGVFFMTIRASGNSGIEYGLFRSKQ
jgi:hypothetical protein